MHHSVMPKVNNTLVGFKFETIFSNTETDETSFLNWCHGEVTKIVNKKVGTMLIIWSDESMVEGNPKISKHKLQKAKWNPKVAKMGHGERPCR